MTTDRKIFIFTARRGIMAEIEYPGIAKLVSRLVWDQETVRSSRTTRTKIPLKLLISEGFFLFFVYCGAGGWTDFHKQYSLGYYSSMCTLLALIECSLLPK